MSRKQLVIFGLLGSACCLLLLVSLERTAGAEASSPVGVWRTIDDNTKQPKAHVQIAERNGKLSGRIIKLFNPVTPNPKCTECSGSRKNQPITGMTIMWGLSKGDDGWWEDGHILDPENGKTYRCRIKLTQGGKRLQVRGFVGFALLGRTQTWHRVR